MRFWLRGRTCIQQLFFNATNRFPSFQHGVQDTLMSREEPFLVTHFDYLTNNSASWLARPPQSALRKKSDLTRAKIQNKLGIATRGTLINDIFNLWRAKHVLFQFATITSGGAAVGTLTDLWFDESFEDEPHSSFISLSPPLPT